MPEGAWRDAKVLSYVHSGRALFPWRRGFEGLFTTRPCVCTVDFSHVGLMPGDWWDGDRLDTRRVNGFTFQYKGQKDLRWRPWPMVFLSPGRIIANAWPFHLAGYRHAMHWHRQLFGVLDQPYELSAEEEAAFPPRVLVALNRI